MHNRSARSRHTRILKLVRRVRARWRLRIALRGLSIVLGTGLVAFLFSAYGLEYFRFSPRAVQVFRWGLWLTGAGLLVRYLIWPLSRRVTDEQAALYLEEHEPSLETAVLSAMEAGKGSSTPGVSEALVDRLVESALQKARAVKYGTRIEQQGLYKTSGALAAVSFLALAVMVLGPAQLRHGASALLNPTLDPSLVNPYSISVTPGDVAIARGSDQMVTADLQGFETHTDEFDFQQHAIWQPPDMGQYHQRQQRRNHLSRPTPQEGQQERPNNQDQTWRDRVNRHSSCLSA